MKDIPILMSAPMVCAILDGTKTMTRRTSDRWKNAMPGDHLWVRETFGFGTRPDPFDGWRDGIEYRADEAYLDDEEYLPLYPIPKDVEYDDSKKGWKPSIFMPRWASRIKLELISKRREPLQDISDEDAIKEGAIFTDFGKNKWGEGLPGWSMEGKQDTWEKCLRLPRFAFGNYFNKINGPETWDLNPLVWALELKRII